MAQVRQPISFVNRGAPQASSIRLLKPIQYPTSNNLYSNQPTTVIRSIFPSHPYVPVRLLFFFFVSSRIGELLIE